MGTYKHLVRSESDAPPTIVAATNLCSTYFGLGTFVDHGFLIGDRILLSGFVIQPELNGVHTITDVPDPQSFITDVPCSGLESESGFVQLYDESTFTEVFPLGFTEADFDYTRGQDKIYFYKIYSGILSFTNRPADSVADYSFFLDIDTNNRCEKIEYILQKLCNGSYQKDWQAYLSVTDGEWDRDKCIFKIKPVPDDNIDCMERDVDLNLMDVSPAVTTFYNAPALADRNYTNTRLLSDVLDYLVVNTCIRINGVVSDFFQINPENTSTINYVTGEVNPYTQITIGMKIDIKEPIPATLSTDGIMTFKEMMRILNSFFQVYWTIDESNNVRIEHISYFAAQPGIDATQSKYDKWTINTNKYTYNKNDQPSEENWTVDETSSKAKIVYSDYCSNTKSLGAVKNYNTGKITTNLILLRGSPDSVKSTDGFVIMATAYNAGTGKYDVLSWANNAFYLFSLILKFFRYNRSLLNAEFIFNGTSYGDLFIYNEKKVKAQKEFSIPLCCDDDFDPSQYLTTNLGNGNVSKASFIIKSDILKLELIYGSSDLPDIIPSDLSNLALWLKADDANPAGAISSWTDQSGNGRHAVQATGAKQPIKVLNVVNGLPAIRFDGINDDVSTSSFQPFPSKRGSLFILFKSFQPIRATDDQIVEWSNTDIDIHYDRASGPGGTPATTLNRKYISGGAGFGVPTLNAKIGENIIDAISGYKVSDYGYTDFVLFEFIRNSDTTIDCYGNGSRKLTTTLIDPSQPLSFPFKIGGASSQFKGDIAEIILYDSALNDYDRQRIELYLTKKWSLFPYA